MPFSCDAIFHWPLSLLYYNCKAERQGVEPPVLSHRFRLIRPFAHLSDASPKSPPACARGGQDAIVTMARVASQPRDARLGSSCYGSLHGARGADRYVCIGMMNSLKSLYKSTLFLRYPMNQLDAGSEAG